MNEAYVQAVHRKIYLICLALTSASIGFTVGVLVGLDWSWARIVPGEN